ncbi:DNA glycosylase [Coniochaeta ligniaria NRRL 30616]|uniref:Adenine DNA glycosylase n=1 Tax=Coniochaeta ligniaria NRRL 30616 TaxID=1408157 RepID=A0A1J7JQT6_9PEZI|nr:DNA glycosylase [Coniochaeta ligniaria NRRL 30616]
MGRPETRKRKPPARPSRVSRNASSDDNFDISESGSVEPPAKRRRVSNREKGKHTNPWKDILSTEPHAKRLAIAPTARSHDIAYHRPLLLDSRDGREALLAWFDGVSSSRLMPWRKPWIDPRTWDDADVLRAALERRAYEVWISEVMLQQTRVAVVIDYWKRWMAKWPTIQDLARASAEDVLSAWRGLGYYSRATRIHQAAQLVVEDPRFQGLLPADVHDLKTQVPGIGPYTAGAISAIVFGHPEAMVDGNVVRVMSRQMGVFADFKASKSATDMTWDAADALAKAVSSDLFNEGLDATDLTTSDRPGRWGQALMELGSTVCTPKPDCSICPITSTCRVFAEGMMMTGSASNARERSRQPLSTVSTSDIEDVCTLCQPMEETVVANDSATGQPLKRTLARARRATSAVNSPSASSSTDSWEIASSAPGKIDQHTLNTIVDYARRFPVKGLKKAARIEESLVCAIRCGDFYLIQKRPSKGLLAGLWELPSYSIPKASKSTALSRKRMAQSYVSDLLRHLPCASSKDRLQLSHVGELGSVPWLFSHIKLTMHVHMFDLEQHCDASPLPKLEGRWATNKEIEKESMGTGMRKCWAMVKISNL